jgi:3-deoxy-7-phosphoheptulonate synthase
MKSHYEPQAFRLRFIISLGTFKNTNNNGPLNLWQPHTWRSLEVAQQPAWESKEALNSVGEQLQRLPGLVGPIEIESLKQLITEAGQGRRFILQGGDCAERFKDCREEVIRGKLQILMQMALIMGFAGKRPIVPIGRMAGQYAKPRSESFEKDAAGRMIPIFRGESVNSFEASMDARRADPLRLLQCYHSSSATLNFIRMLMGAGFGNLQHIEWWDQPELGKGAYHQRYEQIAKGLKEALSFISTCSDVAASNESLSAGFRDFFISHEALLLPYEEALTRFVPEMGRYYNLSTHMVWIGDRTRNVDGAHVEYCRGIGNPVGIKIAAGTSVTEIIDVINKVNPHNDVGKITLITRIGSGSAKDYLPELIRAVNASGYNVTWSVDPMHGNTVRAKDGRKTRRFDDIAMEVRDTFEAHRQNGSVLGGIHLEMTSGNVTECTGGASGVTDEQLPERYETWCDPRLNAYQSLEMAFVVASCLRMGRNSQLL